MYGFLCRQSVELSTATQTWWCSFWQLAIDNRLAKTKHLFPQRGTGKSTNATSSSANRSDLVARSVMHNSVRLNTIQKKCQAGKFCVLSVFGLLRDKNAVFTAEFRIRAVQVWIRLQSHPVGLVAWWQNCVAKDHTACVFKVHYTFLTPIWRNLFLSSHCEWVDGRQQPVSVVMGGARKQQPMVWVRVKR